MPAISCAPLGGVSSKEGSQKTSGQLDELGTRKVQFLCE